MCCSAIGSEIRKKAPVRGLFSVYELLINARDVDLVDNVAQALSAVTKLLKLFLVEVGRDARLNAMLANDGKKRQANVRKTILAVHHSGNGHSGVGLAENALADIYGGNGNSIEGCALACNDLSTRCANVMLCFCAVKGSDLYVVLYALGVLVHAYNRNGCLRPRNEGGVAMLAQYVCVYVLLADVEVVGKVAIIAPTITL